MGRRTKILMDEFKPVSVREHPSEEELRWAIMLNPRVENIKNAMDENGRQLCMEFIEYVVKNTTGHSIDKDGNIEFKFKGEWVSKEKLFENFL